MFSPRGVMNLAHTEAQRDQFFRRGNQMRLNGIDAEWLTRDDVARFVPHLDCSDRRAFRSSADCCSGAAAPRGTTPSPGATRAAHRLSASTSSRAAKSPASRARQPDRRHRNDARTIGAGKVGIAVAGHSGKVAGLAGSSCRSRAMSAGVRVGAAEAVPRHGRHLWRRTCYISQSDKGELVWAATSNSIRAMRNGQPADPRPTRSPAAADVSDDLARADAAHWAESWT
jgi:sarcosine oxidase subunit beta